MSLLLDSEQGPPSHDAPVSSAFHPVPSSNNAPPLSNLRSRSSPFSSDGSDTSRGGSPKRRGRRSRRSSDEADMEDEGDDSSTQQHDAFAWPSTSAYDERRQLIGTEEESSERPSSDEEEDEKNVWAITKEQLYYYTTQFFNMQPNPRGVIPGSLAKEFFEKSRLPIAELRKIWQLSDVTKDGCLSLEEFLTAMHLVVLRRNDIQLPEELPPCLKPINLRAKVVDRHNKDLYKDNGDNDDKCLLVSDPESASIASFEEKPPFQSIEPGKPAELSPGGSVGSPRPANFDFQPVAKRDPNIIQPVALRLSPDSPAIQSSDDETIQQNKTKHGMREVLYEQLRNQDDLLSTAEESLSSLTLKQSRQNSDTTDADEDLNELNGPVSLPHHFDNVNPLGLQRKEGTPPPPPPRPGKHARSSSLDLNHRNMNGPPPVVPPRYPFKNGASRSQQDDSSARSLQMSIQQLKEMNSVVARTINELHQEVSDALEERITLEYQLEQLKSFGE